MKITIGGRAGSGKSTVARLVAEKLGLKHYSMGDLWREMADERGVSILELNRLVEKDKDIDLETDRKQEELGKREDDFVIDSRLGFHFIPDSIKIFLDVGDDAGAERIFNATRGKVEEYSSVEATKQELKKREESELKRYKKLYGVDYTDKSHYDAYIDTTSKSINEVVDNIVEKVKSRYSDS
ncbi:AAA family ATPase [Candidatus Woesearchaeota archaeon]|nr:AAA family ATPase [Candidatus Woesearchaeota archaeon]